MEQIKLKGFEPKEIQGISGKVISFKKISISSKYDYRQFYVQYSIYKINGDKFSSPIHPDILHPISKFSTTLNNSPIKIPDNSSLFIQMVSVPNKDFDGDATIDYEVLIPIKIIISEIDKENAHTIAVKNIARFFNISDWKSKTNDQLLASLSSLKNKDAIIMLKLLINYLNAYDDWFSFYQNRKSLSKTKSLIYLTSAEDIVLKNLTEQKVSTLNNLQQAFDELQIKAFNRQNFGKDIQGIIFNK
jgi:hypothetical protein